MIQLDLRIFFSDGLKFNKPPTRNPFSKTKDNRDFFEFLSGRSFFDLNPNGGQPPGRLLRACDYYERGSSFMDVIEAEDLGMPGEEVVLGWRNSMDFFFGDPMGKSSPFLHHQFGRICFGTFSRHIMQIQDSIVKSKGLMACLEDHLRTWSSSKPF